MRGSTLVKLAKHRQAKIDLDLVGRIYEAATIPSAWPDVLSRLASSVDAFGGALVAIDGSPKLSFVCTETYREPYEKYSQVVGKHRNPRAERALARRYYNFLPDTDLCSIAELENDPLYSEVLFPYGIGWTIGCPIPSPSSDLLYFDICRKRSDTPFDSTHAAVLDEYRPHLARASLMATRLRMSQASATVEALSWIGLPAAVLTTMGKVLATNPAFEALGPRVAIGAFNRISLINSQAGQLLERALIPNGSDISPPMSIPVPAGEGEDALILHVVRVEGEAADVFVGGMSVLFVTPVRAPHAPLTGVVAGLFDLTPSEADVARDIAGGLSIQSIARTRGISIETVRTQLKGVLAKTGTHRQVELVRLLLGAAIPQTNVVPPAKV